jgi:lysophospholipid acyltransferase (LPLAT)-like uncharacterized protein
LKLKKAWKRFYRSLRSLGIVQWPIAVLFYIGMRLVHLTSRVEVRGDYILRDFKNRPAIFVFWHGRSMMLSPVIRRFGIKGFAVAEREKDGRFMARLQRMFGLRPIFGSAAKGAVGVLRQGVRALRSGNCVCLSPDGPKGPAMRLSDGCIYFAKMSGAPIIPLCYSASRPWFRRKRWDKYLVAKFFGRIICHAGAPFYYDGDMDGLHKKLEAFMIGQQNALDKELGVSP